MERTNSKFYKNKNWKKNIKKYKLEGSLNWKLAIVKINKFSVMIETEEESEGYIELSSINWTKKSFEDLFEFGDLIYVKKIRENKYDLMQMPKVNGAILIMDPYTGRVLALSGGFSFKKQRV